MGIHTEEIKSISLCTVRDVRSYLRLSILPLREGLVTFRFDSMKPDLVGCFLVFEKLLGFFVPFLGNTPEREGWGLALEKSFFEGGFELKFGVLCTGRDLAPLMRSKYFERK